MLAAALEKAGVRLEDCFLVNALLCQPTESPPSNGAIASCRERLADEVLAHPRKVIFTMGNSASRGLLGEPNFKITSRRGHPIDLDEIGLVLPTFHPASILRNQGEYPRWLEDVKYGGRLLNDGKSSLKRPPKATAWVILKEPWEEAYYPGADEWREWDESQRDGSQLEDWPIRKVLTGLPVAVQAVNELLRKPLLSGDIETGFSYSPRIGKVIVLSVAWSQTEAIVFSEGLLDSKTFRPHLVRLLTEVGPEWVGHNWNGYDSGYLLNRILDGQWPLHGAVSEAHDTLLQHYTLDETKGTHDLESLARDNLGAQDYKYVVKRYTLPGDQGYENVPREVLYPYAALDTCHTFALHERFYPKILESKSLTKLYHHLLLPGSRFLSRVQEHGLYVDQDFLGKIETELTARVEGAHERLAKEVAPLWDTDEYMASPWATKKRPDGYNSGNYRHTSFILEKLIGWVPMNTNERTLRDLDQTGKDQSATFGYKAKNYARGHPNRKQKLNYPYIQALIDVRLGQQAHRQLVKGTRKYLEPDGRLHSIFKMHATETGRLSSTQPNLQNLPVPEKGDLMPARNIVGAPPGRVLIEADYSQVELRLLAHFSDDDNLLGVYRDGRDLHTELSIAIWGPTFTNYQRVRAKAVNFGIAYGRGAGSIAAEHDIPEAEAEEMRQAWFRQFPDAAKWLTQLHQAPLQGRTVITPFGRRRRFGVVSRENYHELKNQSANFPMQSTASDLNLYSAMRVQEQWDRAGRDAHIVCLVHDAVVVECAESEAEEIAAELRVAMEDTPRRVLRPKIDFPVDIHIGRSWGTLKLEEMTGDQKTSTKSDTFGKQGIASGRL